MPRGAPKARWLAANPPLHRSVKIMSRCAMVSSSGKSAGEIRWRRRGHTAGEAWGRSSDSRSLAWLAWRCAQAMAGAEGRMAASMMVTFFAPQLFVKSGDCFVAVPRWLWQVDASVCAPSAKLDAPCGCHHPGDQFLPRWVIFRTKAAHGVLPALLPRRWLSADRR